MVGVVHTHPLYLVLASRFQLPMGTSLRSGFPPHWGDEGAAGGGLVFEENKGGQPTFYIFKCTRIHATHRHKVYSAPIVYDDGAVVNSNNPASEGLEFESRINKLLSHLKLNLMSCSNSDMYIRCSCVNQTFDEFDTS